MKNTTTIAIIVAVAVASASVTAGIFVLINTETDDRPTLTVFMASSMAAVVEHYKSIFEEQYDCKLSVSAGGSDSLYAQIVMGTTCDVFMTASNS